MGSMRVQMARRLAATIDQRIGRQRVHRGRGALTKNFAANGVVFVPDPARSAASI
jgi:hypothetical protein